MGDHRTRSSLTSIFRELSDRVGRLERSGIALQSFTVATRPSATAVQAGTLIFVSDAGAGSQFQGSDGSVWRTLG